MTSNDYPSANGSRAFGQNEQTLKVEKIQIERKTFIFSLKENPRGRFIRITEDVGGHHNSVIVPSTGLEDFKDTLIEMTREASKLASKGPKQG